MSEEAPPGQALVLAEIAQIRRDYPVGTPAYTPEIHARRTTLYQRAYPEPDEEGQAPAGRQFPEVLKPRREAPKRETSRRREVADDDSGDDALGTYPVKGYVEKWGSHEPSSRDLRQWDRAVSVSSKIGISPSQLAKLRDAMLEDAPIDADDDGGDYSVDDYAPPVAIPDDKSWATFKMARRIAAEHGVSPVAFQAMAAAVMGAAEAIAEPQMRRAQKAAVFDLIHNVGEDNAVRTVMNAQKALEHFRPSGPEIDRLMATPVSGALTLGDHPIMIELLGNVGAAISFDALQKEFRSPNGSYNPRKQRL